MSNRQSTSNLSTQNRSQDIQLHDLNQQQSRLLLEKIRNSRQRQKAINNTLYGNNGRQGTSNALFASTGSNRRNVSLAYANTLNDLNSSSNNSHTSRMNSVRLGTHTGIASSRRDGRRAIPRKGVRQNFLNSYYADSTPKLVEDRPHRYFSDRRQSMGLKYSSTNIHKNSMVEPESSMGRQMSTDHRIQSNIKPPIQESPNFLKKLTISSRNKGTTFKPKSIVSHNQLTRESMISMNDFTGNDLTDSFPNPTNLRTSIINNDSAILKTSSTYVSRGLQNNNSHSVSRFQKRSSSAAQNSSMVSTRRVEGTPRVISRTIGEPVEIGEKIGRPVLVKTVEHEPIIIRQDSLLAQDSMLENLQRIILLAMENKRLKSANQKLVFSTFDLNARIRDLTDRLSTFEESEKEIKRLLSENQDQESKIASYMEERMKIMNDFESFKRQKEADFSEVQARIQELIGDNKLLNERLAGKEVELSRQIHMIAAENESLRRESELREDTLNQENQELNEELETLKELNSEQVNTLNLLNEDNQLKDEDIRKLREELLHLQKDNTEFSSIINNLKMQLNNQEECERLIEDLKTESMKRDQELINYQSQLEDSNSRLANFSNNQVENEELQEVQRTEIINLNQDLERLMEENKRLIDLINERDSQIQNLDQELDHIKDEIDTEISVKVGVLANDLEKTSLELKKVRNQYDLSEREVERLQGLLTDMTRQKQILEDSVRDLESEKLQLLNERDRLRGELDTVRQGLADRDMKIKQLERSSEQQGQYLKNHQNSQNELNSVLSKLRLDLRTSESEVSNLNQLKRSNLEEIESLKRELQKLKSELDFKNEEVTNLHRRLGDEQGRVTSHEGKIGEMISKLKDLSDGSNLKVASLEEKMSGVKGELITATGQMRSFKNERDGLNGELKRVKSELEHANKMVKSEKEDNFKKSQELTKLRREVSDSKVRIDTESRVNSDLKRKVDQLEKEVSNWGFKYKSQEDKIKNFNQRYQDLQSVLDNSKLKNNSLSSSVQKLKYERDDLAQQLAIARKTIATLESQLKTLQEEKNRLVEDYETLMRESKALVDSWVQEKLEITERNNNLEILLTSKNSELDRLIQVHGVTLIRLAMVYAEFDRLTSYK